MKVGDLVRECGQYGIGIVVNIGATTSPMTTLGTRPSSTTQAAMIQVKYNFHPVPLWSHINHLEAISESR